MEEVLFSTEFQTLRWKDLDRYRHRYGPKCASLLALPHNWTPPFALFPAVVSEAEFAKYISSDALDRLTNMGRNSELIVRSSVLGETIWDRGRYLSIVVPVSPVLSDNIIVAVGKILQSAEGRQSGIAIQEYVAPRAKGEFGNLTRISKTRDHWELETDVGGIRSQVRLNSQRDKIADTSLPIKAAAGLSRERLFGSIGSWVNNELMEGQSLRVSVEWIEIAGTYYLVQIDSEAEDVGGWNPYSRRVGRFHRSDSGGGQFLEPAHPQNLDTWDKTIILKELWEPEDKHKPTLFILPTSVITKQSAQNFVNDLSSEFDEYVGPNNIVVRTSVRSGCEKVPNLPRTEGLTPMQAAEWCTRKAKELESARFGELAFVVHRFIDSSASAWVRVDPTKANVSINALWGLPDALQYFPYDSWDVHVPTRTATDSSDYKSHALIADLSGEWKRVRVQNELARNRCISTQEALEVAERSLKIARRLGKPCHIMWFVGCIDRDGSRFSMPWYWTEAHETIPNQDRSSYKTFRIEQQKDIDRLLGLSDTARLAIVLSPTDIALLRDMKFIDDVAKAATRINAPIMLAGSTLAHAYFVLTRAGCSVVPLGEREYTRIRKGAVFGKIVRDRIPSRIAERKETVVSRQLPPRLKSGYLVGKAIEEAVEVRFARTDSDLVQELGDMLEVIQSIGADAGFTLEDIKRAADSKRELAGGFGEGFLLLQTGVAGANREELSLDAKLASALGALASDTTLEVPFTFFGFAEKARTYTFALTGLGVSINVSLLPDRLRIEVLPLGGQLSLPLES